VNVIHDVTIDLLRPQRTVIRVTQEDSARKIRMTLLADNAPYNVAQGISEEVLAFVEYRKADGTGGMYDTTATGDTAVELEDTNVHNVWLVSLDGNCFTCPGWCQVNVRFETESGKRIHTFAIMVDVSPTASSDTESTDWGELNSIADLRNAVAELAEDVQSLISGGGLNDRVKAAILSCFSAVGWAVDNEDAYIEALRNAFYPPAPVVSISAVFDDSDVEVVYTDTLNSLRPYLTVYANYENGVSAPVTDYTLSGELVVGTSTVTVTYREFTTTFEVTAVIAHDEWENDTVSVTLENKTINKNPPTYQNNNALRGGYNGFAVLTSAEYNYTVELVTELTSVTEFAVYRLDANSVAKVAAATEQISYADSGYVNSGYVATNAVDGGALWFMAKSGTTFDASKVQIKVTRRYK